MLLPSYWTRVQICVYIYICIYIYKAIQAWWEDISVSSSNIKHFCHYTASCPFSNHITSISLLAKRLNNGETHSHLHNVRSTTLVATFSMTLQQTLALARQGPNARLQVICCEFPNLYNLIVANVFWLLFAFTWRSCGSIGMTMKTSKYRLPAFIHKKIQHICWFIHCKWPWQCHGLEKTQGGDSFGHNTTTARWASCVSWQNAGFVAKTHEILGELL